MKVVLFADQDVGFGIAEYLIDRHRGDLVLILTTEENRISDLAGNAGVATLVFRSEQSVISALPAEVDLGILAWWPRILKRPLIELPRRGFINTHPSLLPLHRGKHPNFWALVDEAPYGVTLHRVDPGIDTGEIVAQREIPYGWEDDGQSLYLKAQDAMLELFRDTYPILRSVEIESRPQDDDRGTSHHSSEIDAASEIDLERRYRARDLLNLLRARTFEGHPGCWFEDNGERFEISVKVRKIRG